MRQGVIRSRKVRKRKETSVVKGRGIKRRKASWENMRIIEGGAVGG